MLIINKYILYKVVYYCYKFPPKHFVFSSQRLIEYYYPEYLDPLELSEHSEYFGIMSLLKELNYYNSNPKDLTLI